MITKDSDIVKKIFYLLDAGIVHGYDSFKYVAEVCEGYIEEELTVELNGVEQTDADTNFNGAVLYSLIEDLKASSLERGENWKSFVISYERGGEVKTNFIY
ncbi:hypothetical protein [Grimontia marina]|uniref:Uncharacterized protein n=1 Tax=Grimontia marina TaxID=646534 RepID=A0A128FJQ8_9GAMM|nr:hypothetical protein [Grimontia marina]CZF87028.1 hypothetical protein GMA8713_05069 [Grimontia marina]